MTSTGPTPRERRLGMLVFAAAAIVALGFSVVGWQHNVLEGHEFRQAQTALTIRWLQRGEWAFAYPLPLFGPPWSAPMEFPWFEGSVAAILSVWHLPLEPTARAVSLLLWGLTLPGIFHAAGLLGLMAERRWYLLAATVLCPLYLYYSRTIMIESTALCAAIWFLCCLDRALQSRRTHWLVAAAVMGAIAALAKITTFAVFLGPAGWLVLSHLRAAVRPATRWNRDVARLLLVAGIVVLVSASAGVTWTIYSDAIKTANPLASTLSSRAVGGWVYGSVGQRVDPVVWRTIGSVVHRSIVNGWLLGPALLGALACRGAVRLRVLGLVGCYLAGPLLFANLYAIHDYYHYANGLFLIAATVQAWTGLCDRFERLRRIEVAGVFAVLVIEVVTFSQTYFRLQERPDLPPPELGRLLQAATKPGEFVLIYGYEWNPVVPYFADRKAVMVRREHLDNFPAQQEVVGPIRARIAAVVFHSDTLRNEPLIRWAHDTVDLDYRPVLSNGDTRVYFPRPTYADAINRLRTIGRESFTLHLPPENQINGIPFLRQTRAQALGAGAAEVFSPPPTEILTPWGLARTTIDGQPALNAHTPTDVFCELPAGARTVSIEFGIAAEAYSNPAGVTDGVEFRIDWIAAGKDPITLFSRWLSPIHTPTDRGVQSATVALSKGATGQLVFRTLPGPANNLSFDWAYWRAVRIR